MQAEKSFKPTLICLNCDWDSPYIARKRRFKHAYSTKFKENNDELNHFLKEFKQYKYIHSIEAEYPRKRWPEKSCKWFNGCAKSVRHLKSLRANGKKARNFLSKFPCSFLQSVTITYSRHSFKWTKYLMRTLEELNLSISNQFKNNKEVELSKLPRLFDRGPTIKKCNMEAQGCQAIGLRYLTESLMKVKKTIQYNLIINFEKIKYERIEPLNALENNLRLQCEMDFNDFKLNMKKTMEQLENIQFTIDFGVNKKQLVMANMISKFTNLKEAVLLFQFTWAQLKIREVLDNIKLPPNIKDLTLMFVGGYDNNEPYGKDAPLENSFKGLNEAVNKLDEVKMVRSFLKEINKLKQLESFSFHIQHYSEQFPFYYYLMYATASKLQPSVRDVFYSISYDKVYTPKINKYAIDVSYLLQSFKHPDSIECFRVKCSEQEYNYYDRFQPFQKLKTFVIVRSSEECINEETRKKMVEFFKQLIKGQLIEQLKFPIATKDMLRSLVSSPGLKYINLLSLYDDTESQLEEEEIEDDEVFKSQGENLVKELVSWLTQRRYLKQVEISGQLGLNEDGMKEAKRMIGNSNIKQARIGHPVFGISKDGYSKKLHNFYYD